MRFKFLALCVVLSGAISVSGAFAASPNTILVNVSPENPAPFEDVSISLNSYSNNLDSILISWSVNGATVSSGVGKKSFSVKAPASGAETIIRATINLPDGVVEKRVVIRPNVMVLLWQANDSYVPPFYRGKALPSLDSEIKVVALPEIKVGSGLADAKNMTYTWKKDYTNMQGDSGYGKNFFLYTNDYLENSNTVSVTASTVDQKYSSEGSIAVGATEPKIVLYRNDSVSGILWQRALTDPYGIEESGVITAIPYFISPKELLHPSLLWSWFINNSLVSVSSFRKNSIPLQTQGGVSGTSKLRLQIENQDKIFQTVTKEINVEF